MPRTLFARPLLVAIGFAACLASSAQAQKPIPPLPDDVRPIRASGVGLHVADLERSKRFYTEVLGFKVATRIPPEGPAREYILGMTGDRLVDTLVVLTVGNVEPGARVILVVPSGRKMAERVAAAGYPPERIVDGTNFVKDPDGYAIELYQRPPPQPAAAPLFPAPLGSLSLR